MKKYKYIVVAFVLGIAMLSCEKFADGGLVTKAEKRITNDWKLTSYHRNGTDETSLIFITNYVEQYGDDGSYTRSYSNKDGDLVSEEGSYAFDTDKTSMDISGVSSIGDFSEANSTVSSSTYSILRLTKEEFWYSYSNGGDAHEFRMSL